MGNTYVGTLVFLVRTRKESDGIWSFDVGREANITVLSTSPNTTKNFGFGSPPSGKMKGLKYNRVPDSNMVGVICIGGIVNS